MKLNISNIQHFSVGDGPGIRTTVFFKGCNLSCPWCHNPENLSAAPCTLLYPERNEEEVCGRRVTIDEILPELLEDLEFFEESGGGITLSGGEVMLQADKAAALAKALQEKNISVLIDTAGCVPFTAFEKVNPYVSGYLFDYKTADDEKCKAIGSNLPLVTENIRRLLELRANVTIRIPVIPGFNDDSNSIKAICFALKDLGIEAVDLLPFHRLGTGKYEAMGLNYAYKDCEPFSKEAILAIKNQYEKHFRVKIEK